MTMNLHAAINDELIVVGGPADIKLNYKAINSNNPINLSLIDEQNIRYKTMSHASRTSNVE